MNAAFFMPRSLRNFPTALPGNVPKARLKNAQRLLFFKERGISDKGCSHHTETGNENSENRDKRDRGFPMSIVDITAPKHSLNSARLLGSPALSKNRPLCSL